MVFLLNLNNLPQYVPVCVCVCVCVCGVCVYVCGGGVGRGGWR